MVGRKVLENGVFRVIPHVIDCVQFGKCTNPSCGYEAGHQEHRAAMKEQKRATKAAVTQKQQEQIAAVAGMKAPISLALDQQLKEALTNSNMSM
jgi:hypothetical protein